MATTFRRIASPFLPLLIGVAAFLAGVGVAAIQAHLREKDEATAVASARSLENPDGQWVG